MQSSKPWDNSPEQTALPSTLNCADVSPKSQQTQAQRLCMVLRDLHNNVIWDSVAKRWNRFGMVKELNQIDLQSFYHEQKTQMLGQESSPCFSRQHNLKKSYHIDYYFASTDLINICKVDIAPHNKGLALKDQISLDSRFKWREQHDF